MQFYTEFVKENKEREKYVELTLIYFFTKKTSYC